LKDDEDEAAEEEEGHPGVGGDVRGRGGSGRFGR
jgi:hypothetical protein